MKISALVFLISILFLTSCVEKYFESGIQNTEPLLVVDATINDRDQVQEVVLSTTGSMEYPLFYPLASCTVIVVDNLGNQFLFEEESRNIGHYKGIIEKEHFVVGRAFKLVITTFDGKNYESDFETYIPCAPIDSIYYELDIKSDVEGGSGIQFYVDIKTDETNASNYKWILEETYKHRSTWPINRRYSSTFGIIETYDNYDKYYGYITKPINGIYLATTSHLSENTYLKYPLNFVNNKTQRLYFKYSLLVEQYSLTSGAFEFWQRVQTNLNESDGFNSKQPINVYGNVKSLDDENEKVLGYFSVSSIKQQRIFAHDIPGLSFNHDDLFCSTTFIDFDSFYKKMASVKKFPYYLPPIDEGEPKPNGLYIADQECFDVTLIGASLTPPDFWIE